MPRAADPRRQEPRAAQPHSPRPAQVRPGSGPGPRPDRAAEGARPAHRNPAPAPSARPSPEDGPAGGPGPGAPAALAQDGRRPGDRGPRTAPSAPEADADAAAPAGPGPRTRREHGTPPDDDATRGEHPHGGRPGPRPPVRRSSVRGQVLDALRTALVTGELRPGEIYSAPALGERFGVSATPVREAMQQLALEGAVEVVPNRGFRVVEREARELAELAEVRALIEVPVLLRLARTVPAERWAALRPLAEATVRAASSGCRAAYAEADRAFHRAMLALSGNEQMVRVAEDLHRRAQWPLTGVLGRAARVALVAEAAQHGALLDALIARDTETVGALLAAHFTATA
ncbi:GntR family transcriptional regulator [Streptomyces sp. NPDC006743]|uniref:GntR family transcriptional regulator n=1 Tax=Streptomyces sp. NPDC006743 TaxID=3154480 RepID=UPI003452B139